MNRGMSWRAGVAWMAICMAGPAPQASVALSGTRLIFDGRYQEVAIEATNRGARDVLIQSWLRAPEDDDDTPTAQRRSLPFVVTPPLHRLAPGGKQTLRILYQGQGMPAGRESLLHLFVTQVPRRSEGVNPLNIAIRQRLNLFYRPPGIQGDPALTAEMLRWSFATSGSSVQTLQVDNPTPYHASLQKLTLGQSQVAESLLLAPGAVHRWTLTTPTSARRLGFQALTDYGAARNYCVAIDADAATARPKDLTHIQDPC